MCALSLPILGGSAMAKPPSKYAAQRTLVLETLKLSPKTSYAFNKFMQQVLAPPAPLPRCMACGAPGPAICPSCHRFHDYAAEVEQRRFFGGA